VAGEESNPHFSQKIWDCVKENLTITTTTKTTKKIVFF
jgi:hypothetical protein